MSIEEQQAIQEELEYWLDDEIEQRLDGELARITKVYAAIADEETQWNNLGARYVY